MTDIIGYGSGKSGSSHKHYEATDSLHNTSFARVLDLVSEGEILGLAKGMESVYLNQTPVENADGTRNFASIAVDFRTGTQDQDYIAGFADVENEISVGVELKSGAPWVRAIGNTELSAVRITLGVPALSKADTTNGDILGYKIDYQIELSKDGGAYQVVISNSFSGKTTSAYQRSARVDLPRATTGWQIRVTRLTPNANTSSIADTTTVVSYAEIIDAKLRYPMSAIVGIQVDAQQFQSVPMRAYDLLGRIIQVPSNYNSITRTYSGVWDGTFKPAWSNNPAWVFRDLVLHDRYGLGDRILPAQLDKWSLYRIAQYCDQMVPNGRGGTEPRFTCNLYLQSRKAAYAVLQDIASIFRGISYWGGGTIMASADMPADPVYVYTAANVIDAKFTRAGSGKATRYTVALVTWNDPEDFYRPKVEYVEDQEGVRRYGIQQAELTAFGCTSQAQAQRAGRWVLATSRLETEALTFDVGLDGAIALPGQIVRISDPSRMGRRAGGRIRSATGRTAVLDKAPVVKAGDNLTVILPTGKSETRAVSAVAGDSVTVATDWSVMPAAQSIWSVDSTELSAPLFRVLSVVEKDELTFSISAIQHEPGKFDFVENGTAITPRTQTALDVSRQAPPASVTLVGYTVSLADVQKLALQVSCAPVPGAVAYEGAYRRGDDNWVAIPRQPNPTLDVQDVLPGTYAAKMAAVNSIGITSIETLSIAVAIAKDGVSKNADVLLSSDAPSFHTNQAGETTPGVITFSATLIALDGPVTWSCVGGTLTNKAAATAQLTFANMAASSAEVTASITTFGRTYSRTLKLIKSRDGAAGADGLKTAVARLFQWAPIAPAKPTGVSTFTWAALTNSGYTGQDGWANPAAANPGTPGWRLFAAAVPLSAAVAATTSPVAYTSAVVEDGVQNGANGLSGLQSYEVAVYQWAATIPAGPVGTGTLTWASFAFGAAPASWALTPGVSPSPGYTLWKAAVRVIDSAAVSSTGFNWSSASITVAGSAGATGPAGTAMYVDISTAGGQVFSRATSTDAFAPTTITLTATPYGGAASANQWQYWTGSAWTNIAGATAATYAAASGAFTGSRVFRVQTTIAGTVYTDEMTLLQVTGGSNGASAIGGFLTNQSMTLAANSAGTVGSFASAFGTFKVYEGTVEKTGAAVAYSVASQTGCTVGITTAGVYSVSAMSADQASATLQAVYGGVIIPIVLSLAKARAGASVAGAEGASYVTAYCASATASTTTPPAPTAGRTSVPVSNSGGIVGMYSKGVPALAQGEFMYQVDGIYNPANDTVTWSVPYWSSLKVASLSAITLGVMGAITSGSMDIGSGSTSWHVDANGNQWAGAGSFASAPYRVSNTGAAVFSSVAIIGGTLDIGSGATSMHVDAAGNQWAGAATYGAAPFRVSNTGQLWAMSGTFGGTLTGTIVKASNIIATGDGGTLNRDPYFTDIAGWSLNNMSAATGPGGAAPANTYVQGTADYANAVSERFPIDSSATYNASVSAWASSGNNRALRVGLNFYDGAGAVITSSWSDQFGAHFVQNFIPGGDGVWRTYKNGGFGAKVAGLPIPAAAKFCSVFLQINAGGSGTSNAMAVTGLRLDLMTEGSTTAPGSIETKHLKLSVGGDISSGQTAFDTGSGFWIEGAGSGHSARMSIGNSAGSKIIMDPGSSTPLLIVNPTLQLAGRAVSITSNPGNTFQLPHNVTNGYCGTHTASISNPVNPSYSWSITNAPAQVQFNLVGATQAAVTVRANANTVAGDSVTVTITCIISDNGTTKGVSQDIFVDLT